MLILLTIYVLEMKNQQLLKYFHIFIQSSVLWDVDVWSCAPTAASDIETLVIPQVPSVGETLAALVAHVRLLASVYLHVGFQAVALVETAIAYAAGERLLSRVDALVSVQVAQVVERLPACFTAKRFLPCVNKLMEHM